jgi:hypothetical protein
MPLSSRHRDSFGLAGWLFADLLLVVAMSFLALATSGAQPVPQITGFSPTSGLVGTSVTISGRNFLGATSVQFNDTPAEHVIQSGGQIVAIVPPGATSGPITVHGPLGVATSGSPFLVQLPPTPTPVPPTLTSLPTSTPTATPTNTRRPTPEPSPTVAVDPRLLSLEPECWSYSFRSNAVTSIGRNATVDEQTRRTLAGLFQGVQGRRAGFVIAFAQSQPEGDGSRVAARINELLPEAAPDVFVDSRHRGFLALGRPAGVGTIEVQVYYLPGQPPIAEIPGSTPCGPDRRSG